MGHGMMLLPHHSRVQPDAEKPIIQQQCIVNIDSNVDY